MQSAPRVAVTFDFGQTLCDLDTAMLARRLGERGIEVPAGRLEASVPEAWVAYDAAIHGGYGGHPWKILMTRLLQVAGAPERESIAAVDWLWTEQPSRNLWRQPIAGMIDIARALGRAKVPVAVLSNSEGRLAELVDELGWGAYFVVVADSGRLGIEKPDPAIFAWTAERLGVPVESMIHVGDSWAADVEGALRAGMKAVWFRGKGERALPEGVKRAEDAKGLAAALAAWGLSLPG